MTKPEDRNPNQTIQMDGIEGLADVQLIDEQASAPTPSSRAVPPPLPPGMGMPSPSVRPSAPPRPSLPAPSMSPPPKRRTGLYAIVFLVMVVVAVGGGLTIGAALRGTPPAGSASAAPSAVASTPAASSSASEPAGGAEPRGSAGAEPRVLVLPTIELADVDAGAK